MWQSETRQWISINRKGKPQHRMRTDWEQYRKKLIWSRDTVMLSDQAWGVTKARPWRGSSPFPSPECHAASHAESQAADLRFPWWGHPKLQGERPLTLGNMQPSTTNSSQFFFPSLQSSVSPPWHYSDVRLDMILCYGSLSWAF